MTTVLVRRMLVLAMLALLANQATRLAAKDQKKEPEPYALLFGTCFNEQGFSLPGARVIVELASEPAVKMKRKKWEMVSSPRGEFAIRLPAGHHSFKVTATREGFKPAGTMVSFEADERQDVVLKLESSSTEK